MVMNQINHKLCSLLLQSYSCTLNWLPNVFVLLLLRVSPPSPTGGSFEPGRLQHTWRKLQATTKWLTAMTVNITNHKAKNLYASECWLTGSRMKPRCWKTQKLTIVIILAIKGYAQLKIISSMTHRLGTSARFVIACWVKPMAPVCHNVRSEVHGTVIPCVEWSPFHRCATVNGVKSMAMVCHSVRSEARGKVCHSVSSEARSSGVPQCTEWSPWSLMTLVQYSSCCLYSSVIHEWNADNDDVWY